MKQIQLFISAMIVFTFLNVIPAAADEKTQEKIQVAVAANFIMPFQEISRLYTDKTGVRVEATYASTGQIYAQILSGAPYDLFLSADQERPDLLHKEGRAETPFVYAVGRVVLWTSRKDLCRETVWRQVVVLSGLRKIAIANPQTAPYGAAAMEALLKTGLRESVQAKLVFAQNIAQAFQYASTGSVDVGFCALSAAASDEGKKGCSFIIDEAPPIIQSACLLKRAEHRGHAGKFIQFLASPEAGAIKKRYGYY